MNRREFLMMTAAAGLAGSTTGDVRKECLKPDGCGGGKILFGACRPIRDAKILKAHGYDFFETTVSEALKPTCSDEEWKHQKERIVNAPVPLLCCNGFIPGSFRITGPKADFGPPLDYAEKALRRAEEVGVKSVVFGSGGARNVPGDFCGARGQRPDILKGIAQFTEFCRNLSGRISDLRTVSVVIEPLGPNESNIINYVWQGLQVVRDVDSPRIELLADIYHMLNGRECARSIVEAGSRLRHCHIACKGSRRFPGSGADDTVAFKPYFDALRQIKYSGGVACECKWPKDAVKFEKALDEALALMKSLS